MNRASFLARLGGGALAAMLPKAVGALETESEAVPGTYTFDLSYTSAEDAIRAIDEHIRSSITGVDLAPGCIQRGGVDPERPFAISADKLGLP